MNDLSHTATDNLTSVGQLLTMAARQWPEHPAVAEPNGNDWRQASFSQLERDSHRLATRLAAAGVGPETRMALLVPPGIGFVSLVFALFKTGATIILIDPGIGRKNLVGCLQTADPHGVVGIARAQVARWIFRKRLPHARMNFVTDRNRWPGCQSLVPAANNVAAGNTIPLPERHRDDTAAIIFTSGSTGPPKGVCYSHGNFITQATEIRDWFGIAPGGSDISGFPLFALFNTAMGKTTVFPKMDFTRPADVNPALFLAAVEHFSADQSFGSPALWNTVGRWAEKHGRRMPDLRRVMSAGAPVPAHVLRCVRGLIAADGEVYTPYGATEALPVACNSASVVLGETAQRTANGYGVCVGSRFARIQWKVIEIRDEPIEHMAGAREVKPGEIGELIVRGPVVTGEYLANPAANALSKIADGESFWHRMGDVGRIDEHNRFWFCGRKSQRVIAGDQTLFTVPCESIINTHPAVYRSGLVGLGPARQQQPAIIVEPWPEHWPRGKTRRERLLREIRGLAGQHDLTRPIRYFLLKRRLPVDIRHNSKIFREQLRSWAGRRVKTDAN